MGVASSLTSLNSPGRNRKLRSLISKNLNEIKIVGSSNNLDSESDAESNNDSCDSGGVVSNTTSIEIKDQNNNNNKNN